MVKENKREQNKRVFNRWASRYDRWYTQFWMKRYQQDTLQTIKGKDSVILDISCGSGQLLAQLEQRGFTHLYGIDIAEEMINKAQQKLKHTKLQAADVHHLPFPDNMFDYVVSTEAFHHYDDQYKALQEMKRVTKKHGTIIISDINFFLCPIHWLFEKLEPGYVQVNNRKQMKELFRKSGLIVKSQQRTFLFAVTTKGVKE